MQYEANKNKFIEISEEISYEELNQLCQLFELLNKWDLFKDQTNTITHKERIN